MRKKDLMTPLSNYILYLDGELGAKDCAEFVSFCEAEEQQKRKIEFKKAEWYEVPEGALTTLAKKEFVRAFGDYCALVPDNVIEVLKPQDCEIESCVIKKVGDEGQELFYDNFGASRRRLVIMIHLNTVEDGGVQFPQAGVQACQVQGKITVAPCTWQYAYRVNASKQTQYVLYCYIRIKNEKAI